MASGKRQPSKQKRTQQNRQQRAARQARASAAGGSTTSSSSARPGAGASGGLLGRLRGAGATPGARASGPRAGGPVDRINRSAVVDRSQQPPGYRAALTGVLAAAAAVVASFFITSPVDADGEVYATRTAIVADWADTARAEVAAAPDADAGEVADGIDTWMPGRDKERMFLAYFPASLAVALPVIGALLVFRAVRMRSSARAVTRAMYATLLGSFLTLSLLQFFLPTVIAVSVAGFQVRKAEMAAARAAAEDAAEGADGPGGQDDVIEADVVDAEVVEPDVVEADVVDADVVDADVVDADGVDDGEADARPPDGKA